MKHEVIITSEQFEEYELLKKLQEASGAILTKCTYSHGYSHREAYYFNNDELEGRLAKLVESSEQHDILASMSIRDFRRLRKRLLK